MPKNTKTALARVFAIKFTVKRKGIQYASVHLVIENGTENNGGFASHTLEELEAMGIEKGALVEVSTTDKTSANPTIWKITALTEDTQMPVKIIKDYDNKAPSSDAFTPVKDQYGDYDESIDFARSAIYSNLRTASKNIFSVRVTSPAMFNRVGSSFEGMDNVTVETV